MTVARRFLALTGALLTGALLTAAVMSGVVAPATGQPGRIKRIMLGTIDFPPGFSTVTAITEVAPGSCAGRHSHPGAESGYVLEGETVLKVEGRPDQTFRAGQWFETSPNKIHDVCTGPGVKILSTYVVEKGKPLAALAP